MVHLSTIPPKKEVSGPPVEGLSTLSIQRPEDDLYTTSVYGSRFATQDLPNHEMPENEMPKEIAYKLIKDELSLDGNPMLK